MMCLLALRRRQKVILSELEVLHAAYANHAKHIDEMNLKLREVASALEAKRKRAEHLVVELTTACEVP